MSADSLAMSTAVSTVMPDVRGVQRRRVVDAIAHEADDVCLARLQSLDDPLLVRGRDAARRASVSSAASASWASVIRSTSAPSRRESTGSPTSVQILRATISLSPVITLTTTPWRCSAAIASRGVLGRIEERHIALENQV